MSESEFKSLHESPDATWCVERTYPFPGTPQVVMLTITSREKLSDNFYADLSELLSKHTK